MGHGLTRGIMYLHHNPVRFLGTLRLEIYCILQGLNLDSMMLQSNHNLERMVHLVE